MALSDELAYRSAAWLAQQIRARQLSPVEVMDAVIARIEARNPSITALVYLAFDEARRAAKAAEQAIVAGEALGPLHGVPTAIKDLFDFKPGFVSTFGGVRALANQVDDIYCVFAERIEQAGAIILGKTNSPVLGFRGVCDNYLFGPSRNPFDITRNTGGSSGGSAGAVADGLLPLAEGTDGGGSIRIPASWCGVYGYKPASGRVPFVTRPNAFGGTAPFLYEGPISRTVEDAAIALGVLAGYDPRDPFCLDEAIEPRAALSRDIKGWRIAYSADLDIFPVDPRVKGVVAEAVKAFEQAGAIVEEVKLGIRRSQAELSDLWCRLIMANSQLFFEHMKQQGKDLLGDHAEDFPPQLLEWLRRTKQRTALELHRDQVMRSEIYDAVQGVFAHHDLLVSPTLACLPVKNATDGNTVGPSEINGEVIDPLIGWCMTYLINFTGHPAASIPAGLADGLPVGLQIVGRRYADLDVLTASAVFEQIRPWQDSYRICQARPLTVPS